MRIIPEALQSLEHSHCRDAVGFHMFRNATEVFLGLKAWNFVFSLHLEHFSAGIYNMKRNLSINIKWTYAYLQSQRFVIAIRWAPDFTLHLKFQKLRLANVSAYCSWLRILDLTV